MGDLRGSTLQMRLIPLLFSFEGRINREPYWLFFGACFLLSLLLQFVIGPPSGGEASVFWLILLWPALAVIVKRYHDRDKSGWWVLVHFFIPPIGVMECGFLRGTLGDNRFGPNLLSESVAEGRAAVPTKKLLQLIGGAALLFVGCLLSSFILMDSRFGKTLDFHEVVWGALFTIALWWAAYFYLKRALSPPFGWQRFNLIGGVAMALFGCLLSHFVAMNFLFGTSQAADLAIPMLFAMVLLVAGVLLSHLSLLEPFGWQKAAGLVYGKPLVILIGVLVLAFVAINGFVFYGTSRFFDNVQASLRENSIFQKHIGEVVRFREDYTATGAKGKDIFVFKVEGTGGTGIVTAELKTVDRKTERLMSGTMVLESGESYDLFPANR